jgi:hypothetical protein
MELPDDGEGIEWRGGNGVVSDMQTVYGRSDQIGRWNEGSNEEVGIAMPGQR